LRLTLNERFIRKLTPKVRNKSLGYHSIVITLLKYVCGGLEMALYVNKWSPVDGAHK